MLENIRIVLVKTSHPGNIGSSARAMKTMGLHDLYLVSPQQFPHQKANELAAGAIDILEKATTVTSLEEAIKDRSLIVGTSARPRTISWPVLSPREFAEKAIQESSQGKIAVLFGSEQSGLTNEELHHCHFHIQIPNNPEYSALNLAAAVQVICYELCVASSLQKPVQKWDYDFASFAEMNGFFQHLEEVLIDLTFLNPKAPRQLMTRLKRLFNRARLDVMEVNILRGILGAIQGKMQK